MLTLNCDNSGNQIETYVEGRGTEFPEQIFRYRNGSGYSTTGDFYSRFSSIRISAGRSNGIVNRITIDDNAAPLLIDGNSNSEEVHVGQNHRVFSADITVQNAVVGTFLSVDDSAGTTPVTATLTDTRLTLPGRVTVNYRPEGLRTFDVFFGNARKWRLPRCMSRTPSGSPLASEIESQGVPPHDTVRQVLAPLPRRA